MAENAVALKGEAEQSKKTEVTREALEGELAKLYNGLVEGFPGFKVRLEQKRMIMATALRLAGLDGGEKPIAVVEAGTGTGKSLGYLVAATAVSRLTQKRIVISTATVLLQQQLVKRDIPAFLKACGLEESFKVREAKGAGRYFCPQRGDSVLGIGSNLDLFGTETQNARERPLTEQERVDLKWSLDRLRADRGGGDLDTVKRISEAVKPRVGARLTECLGRQCPDRDICPMRSARRGLFKTEIIVANHAFILALLASSGVYFAKPDECIYIFDEAHSLAETAERAFAGALTTQGVATLAERSERAASLLARTLEEAQPLAEIAKDLVEAAHRLEEGLLAVGPGLVPPIGALPEALETAYGFLAPLHEIEGQLVEAEQALEIKGVPMDSPAGMQIRGALAMLNEGSREAARAYELLTARRAGRQVAAWVDKTESGLRLNLAPLDVGRWLYRHMWGKSCGSILTSATLRGVSKFDSFLFETGLPKGVLTLALGSPFDLSQSRLVYPRAMALPRTDQHTQLTEDVFKVLCAKAMEKGRGVLVLTASWGALRRLKQVDVGDAVVLSQGSAPKSALLKQHRERIACGKGSVLLGTTSFCEGLDLPHDECRTVLIDKIPFFIPDDPIEASRAQWIQHRGANAFVVRALPAASRRLVQSAGRLVRKIGDCGDVVILDERLSTKRYGAQLLEALGPYTHAPCVDGAGLVWMLSCD